MGNDSGFKANRMKVLIIGGNGFLGSRLVDKSLQQNWEVSTIKYFIGNNGERSLDFNKLDLSTNDFDAVFLLAAHIPYGSMNVSDKRLIEYNINLPIRVVEKFPKSIIFFASSISVYGNHNDIIDEMSAFNNPELYGLSKISGEFIIRSSPKFRIVRFSSLYGKGMYQETFLPRIIKNAIQKKEIILYGDGSRMQNYIHVDDAADFCVNSVLNEKNGSFLGIYKKSYSNEEVAQLVRNYFPGCKIKFMGIDHNASNLFNNDYTISTLGITPKISLERGINDLIKDE